MIARRSDRVVAAILGAASLACLILLGSVAPSYSCGDQGPGPAVLRFQAARTELDLSRLFGPAGTACRGSFESAMSLLNTIDLLAFIPIYAAFLLLCIRLAGDQGSLIRRAAMTMLAVLVAGDLAETIAQLLLLGAEDPALLLTLAIGNTTKTLGLALVLACLAGMLATRSGVAAKAAGAALGLTSIARVAGLAHPTSSIGPVSAMVAYAVLLAWILMSSLPPAHND